MHKENSNELDLSDLEQDIIDVMNGHYPDIEHADAVWKILDGMTRIQKGLDIFNSNDADAIINAKTIMQLDDFIEKMNCFAQYVENFKTI